MGRVMAAMIAIALAACGGAEGSSETEPADQPAAEVATALAEPDRVEPEPEPAPAPEPAPRPYPAEFRSVRLKKSISVRIAPDVDAPKYGTIAAHTRAGFQSAARGPGCSGRWIEIEPFGWICDSYLEPSKKWPHGVELPKLGRGELVPGTYGKVATEGAQAFHLKNDVLVPARELGGSVHVRRYRERTIKGKPYWYIGKGEYVRLSSLRVHEPSSFHGVRLADDTGRGLPLVFAVDGKRLDRAVPTTAAAGGGARVRKLPARSAWPVLEVARGTEGDPTAYRIGEGEWLSAGTAILVEATAPPASVRPNEKWIDVDLDRQVLVAYEGELPVYATLVSTGTRRNPTETGIYRIWIKFAETQMSDAMAETPYSVATVPWTQYYSTDLALHTSYWHDGFATQRSHGCVNLAPIDSRFLYFWSQPELPPGWSMAHGTLHRPGSLVRVRSAADPDPPFRGLAKRVLEARASQ